MVSTVKTQRAPAPKDEPDRPSHLRPVETTPAAAPRGRGGMSGAPIRTLLVGSSGRPSWPMLDQIDAHRLQIEYARGLGPALERLARNGLDLVLLQTDPQDRGFVSLASLLDRHAGLPVVVVLPSYDAELAAQALKLGAIDVLVEDELGSSGMLRAARFAVERAWSQRRQRFTRRVLALFNQHNELKPLLEAYLVEARALTGCAAGNIRLRSDDNPGFTCDAFLGLDEAFACHQTVQEGQAPCLCQTALCRQDPPAGVLRSSADSLVCPDMLALSRSALRKQGFELRPFCQQRGFKSNLLVPIAVNKQTYGLLQLLDPQPDFFDPRVVEELEQTTLQLGLFIERMRSVAALKASEQRYRELIDHAADGIFISGPDQGYLDVNEAVLAMLGYSRDELLQMSLSDLSSQQEVDVAGRKLRAAPTGTPITLETQLKAKNGALIPVEIRAKFLPDGSVLGMARDIRERKQLQAQLAQSDRMASIGMLAAGVAHEINNPLTYVLYNLEMVIERFPHIVHGLGKTRAALARAVGVEMAATELGEDWDNPGPGELDDMDECLRDAMVGAGRVRDIVRDLKVFSRVEEDSLSTVDLRQAIEGAINLAYNEIKYRAQLKKDLPALLEVQANEGRLSQVFLNLLVNAAQAIDEGDAFNNEIAVSAHERDGHAVIEIRDSGKGMSPEDLELIFEPFFTTKPAGIGSGLGLSICRSIVNSYGGHIEVESQLGEGTSFRVFLPMQEQAPSFVAAPQDGEVPPPRKSQVLIVDDDPLLRMLVGRALGDQHEVQQAASGRQCLELLQKNGTYDLILCDVMMPELTGIDVYAALREQRPDLLERFVFMTGGIFTPKAKNFLAQCPAPRITKPFELGELRSFVNGELRRILD